MSFHFNEMAKASGGKEYGGKAKGFFEALF